MHSETDGVCQWLRLRRRPMPLVRSLVLLVFTLTSLALSSCAQKNKREDIVDYANADQPNSAADQQPEADSDQESLDRLGAGATLSDAAILPTGPEGLEARLWLLNNAKQSVRVQSFIFKGDEVGSYVADKLIALHLKGVKVIVAIDELVNYQLKNQILYARMAKMGIKIEGFHPGYLHYLDNFADKSFEDLLKDTNKRYHDKMFIIDGEDLAQGYAIVGGANIANEYFEFSDGDPKNRWKDQDVIVRGPVVSELTKAFDANILNMKQDTTESDSPISEIFKTLNKSLNLEQPFAKLLNLSRDLQGNVAAIDNSVPKLHWQKNIAISFIQSRPRHGEDKIFPAYIEQINKAQKQIDILNSYFLPTKPLQLALIAAAKRGVNIRILTNSPEAGDLPTVQQAGRTLYANLVAATGIPDANPIKIYEWGGDREFKNGYTLHHAKFAVFDAEVSIVGSFNMDPRSQFLNSETIVMMQNKDLAKTLTSYFENDTGKGFARLVNKEQALRWHESNKLLDLMAKQFGIDFYDIL